MNESDLGDEKEKSILGWGVETYWKIPDHLWWVISIFHLLTKFGRTRRLFVNIHLNDVQSRWANNSFRGKYKNRCWKCFLVRSAEAGNVAIYCLRYLFFRGGVKLHISCYTAVAHIWDGNENKPLFKRIIMVFNDCRVRERRMPAKYLPRIRGGTFSILLIYRRLSNNFKRKLGNRFYRKNNFTRDGWVQLGLATKPKIWICGPAFSVIAVDSGFVKA